MADITPPVTPAAPAPVAAAPKPAYIVVEQFRDIDNFDKLYKENEDVSGLNAQRIKDLIKKGLVKKND